MTTWMRNQIANFSHAFSAPIAAKQRTSRRTVGHHETASLLNHWMKDNIEYGQERLKNNVEKEATQEDEEY